MKLTGIKERVHQPWKDECDMAKILNVMRKFEMGSSVVYCTTDRHDKITAQGHLFADGDNIWIRCRYLGGDGDGGWFCWKGVAGNSEARPATWEFVTDVNESKGRMVRLSSQVRFGFIPVWQEEVPVDPNISYDWLDQHALLHGNPGTPAEAPVADKRVRPVGNLSAQDPDPGSKTPYFTIQDGQWAQMKDGKWTMPKPYDPRDSSTWTPTQFPGKWQLASQAGEDRQLGALKAESAMLTRFASACGLQPMEATEEQIVGRIKALLDSERDLVGELAKERNETVSRYRSDLDIANRSLENALSEANYQRERCDFAFKKLGAMQVEWSWRWRERRG